jgi:hypothetical protein
MNHTGSNGRQYATVNKLSVTDQFAIARKLGAVMPLIGPMVEPDNVQKDKTLLTLLMLGNLSDDHSAFVTGRCLSVVTTTDDKGNVCRLTAPNGTFMFQDVTVKDILDLSAAVIEENLGDFFRIALGSLSAQAAKTPSA